MKQRQFDIHAPMPSGEVITLSYFADDETDPDMNYMLNALYAYARYHGIDDPKLVERTEKVIKHDSKLA